MIKTFWQFLEEKKLVEAISPADQTKVIGGVTNAQQVNNPANVADSLVTSNPPLASALLNSPKAAMLKAQQDAIKRKTQPQQQVMPGAPGVIAPGV